MSEGIRQSVYCLATDILDEGPDVVLDNLAKRAGVTSVTVAAKYHEVTDIYPHNPLRRMPTISPGVFFRPTPDRYTNELLKPVPSPAAAGRDVLAEACAAAGARDMSVSAWMVFMHHDEAGPDDRSLQTNCFAEQMPGSLCPANPDARRFAELMIADVASYPIEAIRAESLHFHGAIHGFHHQRVLEAYGEVGVFLLGVCFCKHCLERAERRGLDAARVAAQARKAVEDLFDGRRAPAKLGADTLSDAWGEGGLVYLDVRRETVTSLAARLVEVAQRTGVRLAVIDQTIASLAYATGVVDGDPEVAWWQFGVDPKSVREAGADLELTGYVRRAADLQQILQAHPEVDGGDLGVILRPGTPDLDVDELTEKLKVAIAAGARDVNFYCYGLYRLEALDRIGAARKASL
jgi:hypothetical protein